MMKMNKKIQKNLTLASKIAFNIFAIIFGLTMVGTSIFTSVTSQTVEVTNTIINKSFDNVTTEVVPDLDGANPGYFNSEYSTIKELRAANNKVNLEVQSEGIVLLKNNEVNKPNVGNKPALPLASGNKVSLFSITSVDPVYGVRGAGGVGSAGGAIIDADQKITYKEVLEDNGLDVNDELFQWYLDNPSFKRSQITGNGQLATINDANWGEITTPAKTEAADAAIFVLGRIGNEIVDMPPFQDRGTSGLTGGDYLKLTPKEIDVLTNLKAQKDAGTFKSIILLINSANPIVDTVIDNAAYGIDAALWIGNPGTAGLPAVGDVMVGKTTPSGRMADIWYNDKCYNPALANWGDFGHTSGKYVVYQEGIYLGYRYAETRYEDKVLKTDKVGTFDYKKAVAYPFGYGLSYTNFAYSDFTVTAPAADATIKDDKYTVSVKVTNTGTVAGKEVVQIYLQQPYTDYDKTNLIEKSAVELAGFAKTAELAAGAEETLTIQVEGKYFASYDARGAKTYYLDAGDYYLTAGKDAHDATNNILAAKGKTVADDGMDAAGNADLVEKIVIAEASADKYKHASNTGKAVTNLFDESDPNLLADGVNSVQFMTRSDWAETVKFGWDEAGAKLSGQNATMNTSAKIQAGRARDNSGGAAKDTDTIDYPTYGVDKGIDIKDMIYNKDGSKIAYDDPRWDTFLDQLTWDETVRLLSNGLRRTISIPSINKPTTIDHNGPSGFSEPYGNGPLGLAAKKNDPDKNLHPTGYPSSNVVGSTFNTELAEKLGTAMGEDALWLGNSGMYGLGINLHRSPYHGRFAEYYSEDSFLTGTIAGYQSKGIWSKGCYTYSKHLVLNEQEINRSGHEAWITEQTLRQNYLRQYELCISIGDAMNVMTAFNRIGAVWAGNDKNLCTVFLREEAGMRGFAVTDYHSSYMGRVGGVLAGNDLPDGDGLHSHFSGMQTNHGALANAMRDSAHRILYTVSQSNAMNEHFTGTKIEPVEHWKVDSTETYTTTFPKYLVSVNMNMFKIISGVLFGVSAAFLLAMIGFAIIGKLNDKQKK